MLPDKTERLTLAFFLVRMQIEQAEARGRLDAAELDEAELIAEQEAGDSDSESEPGAVIDVSDDADDDDDRGLAAAAGAAAQ